MVSSKFVHAATSLLVLFTTAAWCSAQQGNFGQSRGYLGQRNANGAPSAPQPTAIHVHHHYYNYQPNGPYSPLIAQQSDPGYVAGPGYLGGAPSVSMEPKPWERNWGGLGFHAYLGQQGQHSGLIVSRVLPDSPASKLGLVVGDVILQVNDQVINDLPMRQIESLFLSLTTQAKADVTAQVFNQHTGRIGTLKAVLVDDDDSAKDELEE